MFIFCMDYLPLFESFSSSFFILFSIAVVKSREDSSTLFEEGDQYKPGYPEGGIEV